jgi:hypothetical protein
MIGRLLLVVVLLLATASPAAAWDPYWDDWSWEEPAVAHEPEPIDDVWWWQGSAMEPAPPPPPVPVVLAAIYYVTEVYVADVISVRGPVTTYSTVTIADTPGTYARVVDTVDTGASSAFDGAAFNGRATLGDGRAVAGTYYENFVLAGGVFVPVSIVFFQDDSVTVSAPTPTPASTPAPSAPPQSTPRPSVPPTVATPAPVPLRTGAPAAPPVPTPVSWTAPGAEPQVPTAPPRRPPVLRPGVAASPVGDIAFTLEVLRGRAVTIWFRALADGAPVPLTSWRVVSGDHIALAAASGGPEDPFRARWDAVTRPSETWVLRVEAAVLVDGVSYVTSGDIEIVVRSPALIR